MRAFTQKRFRNIPAQTLFHRHRFASPKSGAQRRGNIADGRGGFRLTVWMQACFQFLTTVMTVGFLSLLTGCNSQRPPDDASAGTGTGGMTFRWPVPSRFEVEEKREKGATRMTVRHTLNLSSKSNELVVRWLDAEFLSVDGQVISSPAQRQAMAPARAIYLAMSPMRISTNGDFLGVLNNERSWREINQQLDLISPERPQSSRDYYNKLGTTEAGQSMMAQALAPSYWGPWVGAWVGFSLGPGERATNFTRIGPAPSSPKREMILTHLGAVPKQRGQVHLRLESKTKLKGPEFGQVVEEQLGKIADQTIDKKYRNPDPMPKVLDSEFLELIEIQTEPRTLRPSWVKRSTQFIIVPLEGVPVTNRETHEFTFKWITK